MKTLIEKYKKEAVPALQKDFHIGNIMAVPKFKKAVINVGVGRLAKDEKGLERISKDLASITGQRPVTKKAKKSIASFKIREGLPIGLALTLRGKRMFDFMDRFVNIALPRSRDFRGIEAKNLDGQGNLNIGIRESSIFPELNYENMKDVFSLEVTFVTTAKNKEQGMALFKKMGFPIK